MPVINANSVDPDQTPRSAASDLGLHCLPMSNLWDARHKWVNGRVVSMDRNLTLAKKQTLLSARTMY